MSISARLALYRNAIIDWFVARALSLFFSASEVTPEELAAIEAALDAREADENA